ncbi:DUF5666 domain-containing protein [Ramlibacter tataouinensis]|uniref:DUF5666 domain-containing protein n=1 Tax=Ramlibacter tataouinensis TaxID=94132 RepID=UPI0022F3CA8E|nr:DUF5666 domain-containing protein [Ramlibacter tataouinensis]WBY01795.1 DUF5666 domain-containing protein [Ramlibacter tataouinensis]
MRRCGRALFALLVAAGLGLAACGGGSGFGIGGAGGFMEGAGAAGSPGAGDAGTGGTGVAGIGSGGTGISGDGGVGSGGTGAVAGGGIGAVDGFGSIIVNGTRFDTDHAQLQLDDSATLRLGMTVRVTGTLSADLAEGTAALVRSAADLRGTVASVDAVAGTFTLLSQAVATDASTVLAGGLGSIADLRAGDAVQVHGLPGTDAQLRATRVERLGPGATPVLSGTVRQLDAAGQTFRIGGARVSYAGAALTGAWPPSGLAEGQLVRVRGTSAGDPLVASSIEPWHAVALADGSRFSLGGLVTQADGLAQLRVDGLAVDASQAQVSGGPARDVVAGARVEVAGTLRDGVLLASRLRLRHGPGATPESNFSASGPIGAARSPADFRIQGQAIDASGPGVVFVNGSAADIANGRRTRVTGSRVVDDVLVAERVEFL